MLEAGGYHDDADFDGLELTAYQRSYLDGGPFPTVEGQVSIVAGSGVGGGTVINWTNCLRTYDHVRAEWASEHGLSDLAESDFDRHLDAVFERLGVNDECSDLNGPHQRMREGCERLGYDFRLDHPQRRPRPLRARERRLHGLRRRLGLEALDREDLPGRRPGRRSGDLRRRGRGQDPGRGRARRRGRGQVERPGGRRSPTAPARRP